MHHVRWMIRADMPDIVAIERESFGADRLLSEDDIRKILIQKNAIGMVDEYKCEILGYMIYELHHNKLELTRIAVHPKWRRMGAATAMIKRLKSKIGADTRRDRIIVKVNEMDLVAQQFFRQMEFKAFGVIHNHFHDRDAYAMAFREKQGAEK